MKKSILVAPSILSADFSRLAEEICSMEKAGADWIHLDIMDGAFVPNLTFGAPLVKAIRSVTTLPFDAHFMTYYPEHYIDEFAQIGTDYFTIHWEAVTHAHRVLTQIRDAGMKPGISINPATPVEWLCEVLPLVDQVLVMSVNPGFGGQHYLSNAEAKIRWLAQRQDEYGYLIAVDGGINQVTATPVREAGADVLISGSYLFRAENRAEAIASLRKN